MLSETEQGDWEVSIEFKWFPSRNLNLETLQMPLVGKLKFFADCKLKLAANRQKVSGVYVCVCVRRVERATGRMRYMQIAYTQRVTCVCVCEPKQQTTGVCVCVLFTPQKPRHNTRSII